MDSLKTTALKQISKTNITKTSTAQNKCFQKDKKTLSQASVSQLSLTYSESKTTFLTRGTSVTLKISRSHQKELIFGEAFTVLKKYCRNIFQALWMKIQPYHHEHVQTHSILLSSPWIFVELIAHNYSLKWWACVDKSFFLSEWRSCTIPDHTLWGWPHPHFRERKQGCA